MKKYILLLLATLTLAATVKAQEELKFANHQMSPNEIVAEWHDQNLFTASFTYHPNIKDYTLSLAQAYPCDLLNLMVSQMMGYNLSERLSGYVMDVQNGYMAGASLAELDQSVQMCYWRCNDGGTLIAVALQGEVYHYFNNDSDDECCDRTTVTFNDLMFFKIDKGEVMWQARTPLTLCGRTFDFTHYDIQLPRSGKDIILKHKTNPKENYRLKWNGTRFTLTHP